VSGCEVDIVEDRCQSMLSRNIAQVREKRRKVKICFYLFICSYSAGNLDFDPDTFRGLSRWLILILTAFVISYSLPPAAAAPRR